MARQLKLDKPISVTVDAADKVSTAYDTVRFGNIVFEVEGDITEQRASFGWSVGRVVEGKFERIPVPDFSNTKNYPNNDPTWEFSSLIARSAKDGQATLASCQDTVFADLQASGELGAGTTEDYSIYPPGFEP